MRLLRTLLYQTTLSNIQVSDWETQTIERWESHKFIFDQLLESLASPPILPMYSSPDHYLSPNI